MSTFKKLTIADCKMLLKKCFPERTVDFIGFNLEPISNQINGYMGEHLRLTITARDGEQIKRLPFFMKALNSEQDAMADFIKDGNMFNKEIDWYRFLDDMQQYFPDLDTAFAPRHYYSKENKFIILEDLYSNNFSIKSTPLDSVHIKLVLKKLAKCHAVTLVFEETMATRLGRPYRLTENYGKSLEENIYRKDENYLGYKYMNCGLNALKTIIDLLPEVGLTAQEFKIKLTTLFEKQFKIIKPSIVFRNVWCNGDMWSKNVMFKYKDGTPVDCKIFDFQLQRYNPPAHDVIFMIYESTTKIERQCNYENYLNCYYEELKNVLHEHGIDVSGLISRDEFDLTCNAVAPGIKLTKACYATISATSQRNMKKILGDKEKYTSITFEDRSQFASDMFKNDDNYRSKMSDFIKDLRDVIVHKYITIEDCYKIISKKIGSTNYHLVDYKVTTVAEKYGFLGEHSKLKIKVQCNGEMRNMYFFVKTLPIEKLQRNFVLSNNMFFKEMKFYTSILCRILENNITLTKDCISPCYFGRLNDVIVLDDYSKYGYSSRTGYNYDIIIFVIKQLAKLHASPLIFEERQTKTLGREYRLIDDYNKEFDEVFYNELECNLEVVDASIKGTLSLIDLFLDSFSSIYKNKFKMFAAEIMRKMVKQAKPSQKYRNTICHADLWSNNILLKFDGDIPVGCVFIDFQSFRYNPPACDVMFLLYMMTNQKFRAQHMQNVINIYHAEISKIFTSYDVDVNKVLSFDTFLKSCEDVKQFVIPQCIEHLQVVALTPDQIKDLFTDEEYFNKTMYGDRSFHILKTCKEDSVYRKRMKECIEDLMTLYQQSHRNDYCV